MNWNEFNRCFIGVVEESAIEKFGNHSDFAKAAWPDFKNAPGLWRTIRNGRSESGRRDIYVKDMVGMANALGERLSSLIFAAEERLKRGEIPADAEPARRKITARDESTHQKTGEKTTKESAA